jgi:glutathione S-transferase
MISVTALKWVPPFAAGQVRDHRVRWMLNEIGWAYEVDLIDPGVQASRSYRDEQPFGQVPVLRETGRPSLFETGAIVLDLAERSGTLWPESPDAQAQVRSWVIAALNSVEPYLSNVAEADFFIEDEELKRLRRPGVVAAAKGRLGKLAATLGDHHYLVGDAFTAADLMMTSVLRVATHADLPGRISKSWRLSRPGPTAAGFQEGACRPMPGHRCPRPRRHGMGPRDVRDTRVTIRVQSDAFSSRKRRWMMTNLTTYTVVRAEAKGAFAATMTMQKIDLRALDAAARGA